MFKAHLLLLHIHFANYGNLCDSDNLLTVPMYV